MDEWTLVLVDRMKWIVLSTLVSFVAAGARTKPPPGCIVVNKNPQGGQFSTVQAAVDSLSVTDSSKKCIFIYQVPPPPLSLHPYNHRTS